LLTQEHVVQLLLKYQYISFVPLQTYVQSSKRAILIFLGYIIIHTAIVFTPHAVSSAGGAKETRLPWNSVPIGPLGPWSLDWRRTIPHEAVWFVGVCPISLLAFFLPTELQLASFRFVATARTALQLNQTSEQ
jgi:hypothetical protein